MSKQFKKIGLSGTFKDLKNDKFIKAILDTLKILNIEILCDESFVNKNSYLQEFSSTDKKILKEAELVISLGGDGTMLRNSKKYGMNGKPILGINLGTLGFLTDIQTDDLATRLTDVLKGDYLLDERSFLECSLGSKKSKSLALNEIVVHSGSVAKMIQFSLFIDNSFVYKQKADGVIIFSPTGSTAYSLSGGGPLVDPDLKLIGIMPMFPHSINTTPILIEDSKEIRIELDNYKNNKDSELSFDSQTNIKLKKSLTITISKSIPSDTKGVKIPEARAAAAIM